MRIAITSLGMISPVGLGVIATAAAVRAGISTAGDVEGFEVLEGDDAEAVPLRGHAVRGYTDGFHLFGRWLRIAGGCLEDLRVYSKLPGDEDAGFWRRTGLVLATPVLDQRRFQLQEPLTVHAIQDVYGVRLLGLARLPIPVSHIEIVAKGHAGAAAAVQVAVRAIQDKRWERAIVLGVDSHLDASTLEWLGEHGRLMGPDNPVGLRPGEAGACFLLEPDDVAQRRGAAAQAFVNGVASGEEPNHLFSEGVNQGVALAGALAALVPEGTVFAGDLYADLNGEEWRARELATARVRLGARLNPSRLVLPAGSLGDTGAASGAAAVCLAARAFERGYDQNGQALVSSSSEHGHVGAIRLSRS